MAIQNNHAKLKLRHGEKFRIYHKPPLEEKEETPHNDEQPPQDNVENETIPPDEIVDADRNSTLDVSKIDQNTTANLTQN